MEWGAGDASPARAAPHVMELSHCSFIRLAAMSIEQSFQSGTPERKRFIADLFSLFSADIVRCWAADPHSPYRAFDAPVLRRKDASRGSTLDFAFIYRQDLYVALMRCDPLTHGTLHDTAQVEAENTSKAFAEFLDAAQQPQQYIAIVEGREQPIAGSIMIWQRVREPAHAAQRAQDPLWLPCHAGVGDDDRRPGKLAQPRFSTAARPAFRLVSRPVQVAALAHSIDHDFWWGAAPGNLSPK